jgi:RHS repeat-associated protein
MFSSKRLDKETGLYCFGRRSYDPTLGRFVTTDPSGFADGPNLYAYCGGDPVNLIDPDGQLSKSYSSGWNNFTSSLSAGWNQLTQSQSKNTYAQSSFQYTTSSGSGYEMFDDARNKWDSGHPWAAAGSALRETFGRISGFDQVNSAGSGHDTYSMSRLSAGQRLSAGVRGGLSVGLWAAGSVGTIGRGASAMTEPFSSGINTIGRNQAASSIRAFRYDMRALGHSTADINSYIRSFDTPSFRYNRNINPLKTVYRHFNEGGNPGGPWVHDTQRLLSASPLERKIALALPNGSEASGTSWTRLPFLRKVASGYIAPQPPSFTGLPDDVITGGPKQWYLPNSPSGVNPPVYPYSRFRMLEE